MNKLLTLALLGSAVVATSISGCVDGSPDAASAKVVGAVYGPNKLMGRWTGPEGTFLLLAGANGKYAVTIRNLDGPRTFEGSGTGDTIAFERDGKLETIRATDGAATGMKWLADKKECITIQAGEGYCRQ
ncbi:MAG: hypothetical protein V4633_17295 [Pseudomonadota bacterium]